MYAIIENSSVVEFPILSIHQRFPNVSFPLNVADADLPNGVVRVHAVAPPAFNPTTHKPVQQSSPVLVNGRWQLGYTIAALSAGETQERNTALAAEVRAERGAKLAASDWTQVADAPVNKAAWAAYRQALRDITGQPGFPLSINWPDEP
jgi:hypothetical protein